MSSLKYWVWLSALTGLRPKRRFELLDTFGDPEKVYFAEDRLLREKLSFSDSELRLVADRGLSKAESILEGCRTEGVHILCFQDAAYPARLKNIIDPPVVLYVKGKLPAIDEEAAVGVVGTRKATPYGIKMARKLGYEIAGSGGLVVTGLAEGIDSSAAEGALRAGGAVIGVLGCAIDEVFPKWNDVLYGDVEISGALVSEYPPGEPMSRRYFPERNRIISGLSLGVAVIEAPIKSGALITASLALEQGREVFAVPGNADATNCAGSNELIREGARLVSAGWDILEDFAPQFSGKLSVPGSRKSEVLAHREPAEPVFYEAKRAEQPYKTPPETGRGFAKLRVRTDRKKVDNPVKREYIDLREQLSGLSERQLRIVSVMNDRPVHIDDIIEQTELKAPEVLSELTLLQIKGYVSQENGKRFSLNIQKR
ncbi:MAG: DNA-processing protein DprA [Oscillospiraceae bacterium]|nr:DNA-processing protein DprA [Oscillospiraceae bacterium]